MTSIWYVMLINLTRGSASSKKPKINLYTFDFQRLCYRQCERNPCVQGNKACLQAPVSISFHFVSVVSNMSTPRALFRVSAARVLGDSLRFGLLGNRGAGHFALQRSSRQSGELLLVDPVQGPATLEAEVELSELEGRTLLGRYVTKVTLFVSPYSF